MAKDEMTPIRKKIVLNMAECNMRANAVARKLGVDNATVLYHIKVIKAITGKDARQFYDLVELVYLVRGGKV